MRALIPIAAIGIAQAADADTLFDRPWSPGRGGEAFASNYSTLPVGRRLHSICTDDFTLRQPADLREVVLFGSLTPHAWHAGFVIALSSNPCGPPSFLGVGPVSRQIVGVDRTGATIFRLTVRFPFAIPLSANRRYWLSAGPLLTPPARPAFRWSSLKTVVGESALTCLGETQVPVFGTLPGGRRDLAFVLVGTPNLDP